MKKRDRQANLAITSIILLICLMLILITTFTVLSENSEGDTYSEDELIQILEKAADESVDEITTYLKIPYRIGKYSGTAHNQKIQQLALMIKPLLSKDINLSEITITITNGENIKIKNFNGYVNKTENYPIFEHPIWNNVTNNDFAIISTHDKDDSILKHKMFNKNTDQIFLILKLSEDFQMKKGDEIILRLSPASGIHRTITLNAPLPMKKIVEL